MPNSKQYLDFKKIKEQTEVENLLAAFGLQKQITGEPGSDELTGICPLGKDGHGDETSFAFNTAKKTFQCFACKARGSVLDFYKYMAEKQGAEMNLREAGIQLDGLNKNAIERTKEKPGKEPIKYVVQEAELAKAADGINKQKLDSQEQRDMDLIQAGREALERQLIRLTKEDQALSTTAGIEIAELKTGSLTHEAMGMILLTSKRRFIDYVELAQGSSSNVTVSLNYVARMALNKGASAVILCHNHPSGEAVPSPQDIVLTKSIQDCLAPLEIAVLDHIVVGAPSISLAEHGAMIP